MAEQRAAHVGMRHKTLRYRSHQVEIAALQITPVWVSKAGTWDPVRNPPSDFRLASSQRHNKHIVSETDSAVASRVAV